MIRNLIFGTLAACAAFFIAVDATAAIAQEGEHEERGVQSPCGSDKLLEGLTGFFVYKWKAEFVDLGPGPIARWVKYHQLAADEVDVVRVFHSQFQPKVAVATARRWQNRLDGELLVSVLCIIPAPDGALVRAYDPEELESIIAEPGSDA